MKKDIYNYNDKYQLHGLNIKYWNNKISRRAIWKNDRIIGYTEWHALKETNYYIK